MRAQLRTLLLVAPGMVHAQSSGFGPAAAEAPEAASSAVELHRTEQLPPRFDSGITTTRLTDKLYVLEGAGGNVLLFVWDGGALLVDDKIAPATPQLKAAISAVTPHPVRFVVNTHWHPDHRGGNAALAGESAVIVAHEYVRHRLSVDGFVAVFGRKQPAPSPQALPIVTFMRDVRFHVGGEEISVIHVGAAHTDGDSLVRFRAANALHMGDCYLNGSYPVIDYTNGGTFMGTIAAADAALRMIDGDTRVVPGHGPVSNARELRLWRDMLMTIMERVRADVATGASLEQVKRARPTKEWDARFPGSFVTSDHVIEEAYHAAKAEQMH